MKLSNKERPIQWICNQYQKGNISFHHKLQRPINQWTPRMKSLLIHSLIAGFQIDPILIVDEKDISYPIDGAQRTWTTIDYVSGGFSLSKDTPNVKIQIVENGESTIKEFEIAGKKFKKLDKEVQDTLMASTLTFCTMSEYTDDDIKEMFRRKNSGKKLSAKLIRVSRMSDELNEEIYSLATHPFMEKIVTKAQIKNGVDRDLIIMALMLIETNDKTEYTSFRAKDIDAFVQMYSDNFDDDKKSKIEFLTQAMNKLNDNFIENKLKIGTVSCPMMLWAAYHFTRGKKSFGKLVDVIQNFMVETQISDDYKQYCMSGTSDQTNVVGRWNVWKNLIK